MSLAASSLPTARPAQNWIISRNWDIVFIIAAPILAFFWAVGTVRLTSAEVVVSIFMVFNVAHHFPTFIRIYGDRDLLHRFRWELILGPVVPFSLALAAVYYVIISSEQSGQNAENIASGSIFLFIVLLIWDPWHFLMQHYGFMRIYDRHNQAPRKIAARMDLALSWTWFICVLVLISEWLPDLLFSLQHKHSLPLVFLFNEGTYFWLECCTLVAAGAMGVIYAGYLVWCRKHGYYISKAKLWLLVITFGVMYLTYVPNSMMERISPGWNFALGFATLGMVHVTQYLAIVWKYNRGLAAKKRARTKGFTWAFAKGGIVIVAAYVIACLLYGVAVSFYGVTLPFETWNKISGGGGATLFSSSIGVWYGGVLAAVGFTSTFLHYYYDGFIWKFRHKENQQNLVLEEQTSAEADSANQAGGHSWWTGRAGTRSPVQVLCRQFLYLGLPILIVVFTYIMNQERENPRELQVYAVHLKETVKDKRWVQVAELACQGFEEELRLQRKMIQVRPRARHYMSIAEMTNQLFVTKELLASGADVPGLVAERAALLRESIGALEAALKLPAPYGFPAAEPEQRKMAEKLLGERQQQLAKTVPVPTR